MKNLIPGLLTVSASMFVTVPVIADEIQTTQVTHTSPATVVNSWMEPSVSRTRTVTSSDGTSQTVTEPLVMERHERVVIPQTEVTTTNVVTQPKVTTGEFTTVSKAPVARVAVRRSKNCVAYRPKKHFVAHHFSRARRSIAYAPLTQKVVRRTVTEEPRVIQQKQEVEDRTVIMDRRDPALDLY